MAESTPQLEARQRLRHALTRHVLVASAIMGAAGALAFMGWSPSRDAAGRLTLAAAFIALGGAAFALWRDAGAKTQVRALPWVLGVTIGLAGLAAAGIGEVLLAPTLALACVLLCVVTATGGLRDGLRTTAVGAGLLAVVAAATAFGMLAQNGEPAPLGGSVARSFAIELLALAVALGGGHVLGRAVERALRSSDERERRFLGLLAVAADAYWELDAEGRLVRFSAKDDLRSFVGLRRQGAESGLGRKFWETRGVSFDEPVLETFRQELAARLPMRDVPVRWSDFSGRVRHFTLSAEPRTQEGGRFAGYWGVLRDITQDVKARQALRSTETRYQGLFRRIPTPLVLHRGTRVLDANPAGVALFGFPDLRSLLGQDLSALFDEADGSRELALAHLRRLDALPVGEGLPEAEFSLLPSADRALTVRVNSVRVDVAGEAAALSIIIDDTERRASEDLVRRSEALLSHLVATSPDWITLTELPAARYAMVNPTFLATTGYRAEEVIGHTADELALWADPKQRERLLRMLGTGQAVQNVPAVMLTRNGKRVSMLVSASLFTIDGVDYQMTSARDVDAFEQARREREAILENALVGIAFTRDRLIVMTNARFDEMFGWPRGLLQNQPQRMVWPSDAAHAEMVHQVGPALARGEQVDFEVPMMRRDGSIFTGRLLAKALDPASPAGGTIWLAEDVT
ncbi:MAG TPA: PAS domain S-box protein, partial [Burkholderiaceae bacterium]|nr:PAS domain S-box protein [Burkholderiaceae bacterium]